MAYYKVTSVKMADVFRETDTAGKTQRRIANKVGKQLGGNGKVALNERGLHSIEFNSAPDKEIWCQPRWGCPSTKCYSPRRGRVKSKAALKLFGTVPKLSYTNLNKAIGYDPWDSIKNGKSNRICYHPVFHKYGDTWIFVLPDYAAEAYLPPKGIKEITSEKYRDLAGISKKKKDAMKVASRKKKDANS